MLSAMAGPARGLLCLLACSMLSKALCIKLLPLPPALPAALGCFDYASKLMVGSQVTARFPSTMHCKSQHVHSNLSIALFAQFGTKLVTKARMKHKEANTYHIFQLGLQVGRSGLQTPQLSRHQGLHCILLSPAAFIFIITLTELFTDGKWQRTGHRKQQAHSKTALHHCMAEQQATRCNGAHEGPLRLCFMPTNLCFMPTSRKSSHMHLSKGKPSMSTCGVLHSACSHWAESCLLCSS